MTRVITIGLLLLSLGLAIGCGSGDSDAPAGYTSTEIGGLRFVLPEDLSVDESPDDGSLFIARAPGALARQARVVASTEESDSPFLNVVGDIRTVNTSGVRNFRPVSDSEVEVPGSDDAHRVVLTFGAGERGEIPTTRTTIVIRKGKRYFLFSVVTPDAKRDELDVDAIVRSLELT
jgi:hypothetical protein